MRLTSDVMAASVVFASAVFLTFVSKLPNRTGLVTCPASITRFAFAPASHMVTISDC